MPRDYRAGENQKKAKARRAFALARNELREPSTPRRSAEGVTSAPIKADDPEVARMVAAYLARKGGDK